MDPNGAFELSRVSDKVKDVDLLADANHAALKMKETGDAGSVTLPAKAPGAVDSVLVLEAAK